MADKRCLRSEDLLTARQKCSDVLFFLDALHSIEEMEPKAGGNSEEQISRLQQEKQILEQRGQSLENENKSLKRRIEEVLSEEAVCKAHIEKEVSEEQTETLRNYITHLTERYIAKEDEMKRIRDKIDSKTEDYDTLLSEHKALQNRYRGLLRRGRAARLPPSSSCNEGNIIVEMNTGKSSLAQVICSLTTLAGVISDEST
ncbi:hypothetical protein R1sor_008388 [Riccia sorocarpa]|uniref:Uncharacterized protein n=1 Tax=Riccia sorocarpa TaxID=122646 RepID=A0ABD3HWR6_9MARC